MDTQKIRMAFRTGFATELAARGISPSDFDKRANLQQSLVALSKNMGGLAGLAVFGIPAVTGATLGYLTATPEKVEEADIEAIREQDLIDNYKRAIEDMKARRNRAAGVKA